MKKLILLLSIFSISWLLPSNASATHVSGGEITYENVGGDTFIVTLTLYRDCAGVNMGNANKSVRITSSCTSAQNLTVVLQNPNGTEVSQICPSQISSSQCSGGTLPGMQAYYYQGQVVLGTNCTDYLFQYAISNRNTSVNVFNSGFSRFYVEATLNSNLYPNNSSPVYTAPPIPYVCLGQTVNYNYGVVENDGDSLSYSLIGARTATTAWSVSNLTYNTGYSALAPISGISIDSASGQLNFSPSAPTGNYIVAVKVTEYNGAGVEIGSVMRDIQFVVINCSNQIPNNPSSITNLVNTVGTALLTDTLEITATVGDQFCFDVVFSDTNATDTLYVVTNAQFALPGSIVNITGTNPVTANICWTVPPGMNTNNTVTFQASDSACPVSGVNSLAIQIIVPQPPNLTGTLVVTDISCNGVCDGTATVVAAGGVGPYSYAWYPNPPPSWCCQGLSAITGMCAGTYILIVTDAGDPDPSTNTWDTIFAVADASPLAIIPANIAHDDCDPLTCGGSVNTIAFGGTAPRTFLWSNGSTSSIATNLCQGNYTLTVTDANGCTETADFDIYEPTPLSVQIDSVDSVTCFGGNDGVIYSSARPNCGISTISCPSPSSIQIGTGTSTNTGTTYPAIYGNSFNGARHQILYTAAELSAAGVQPGVIGSIGFDIATLSASLNYANFNIKIGCTSSSDLTGGWESGLVEVYFSKTHSTTLGWNTHDFDIDYYWDGISNIVIDVCFDNPFAFFGGNTLTRYTTTANQSVRYFTSNTAAACGNTGLTATSANRPNIRFQNCLSTYTYAWSPAPAASQTTPIASNLTAQTYTVTITAADGCFDTVSATVFEPTEIISVITLTAPVSCSGACDASLSVTTTGGQAPYVLTWNNGLPNGPTQSGLCAGTYILTTTDAKGCSVFDTLVIIDPPTITATTTVDTAISCFGVCDATVTVMGSGGTAPLVVTWPGGLTGPTQNNLCAGSYNVTITDANACFIVEVVNLTEPALLTVVLDTTGTVLCNGDSTVDINSTVNGGTMAYGYLWSSGQTSANLSGVGAGTYTLTVTDANGCTAIDSVTITEPPLLLISISETASILCNGDSTGALLASAIGGTPGYNYLWSNGTTTPANTNLPAGNHIVTVTDANGCQIIQSYVLMEPDPILANSTIIDPISCNGVCDGSVTMAPSGGTLPYTITWPVGVTVTNDTATALCGATAYVVTITDGNGCQLQETINLVEPTLLLATISIDQMISCGGVCDGGLSVGVSGGTPTYSYAWSNGDTVSTLTNLCTGSYSVTVTDANGCTAVSSIVLTEPVPVVANIVQTAFIQCFGDSTASLTASASGGTPGYSYLWSNGGNGAVISNLPSGSYTVTATDTNGCTGTFTFVVNEPSQVMLSVVVNTPISCNGVCDGSATVVASGGTPGYTFTWPNGSTGATQGSLCGDTPYIVTVVDANGCSDTITVNLTEPAPIVANQIIVSPVSCNGVCDGSVTYAPTGGAMPLVIAWPVSVSVSNDTASALCGSTNYIVTISDANGCQTLDTINLNEPAAVVASINLDLGISCNGVCDAQVTASAIGGNGIYTYLWSTGASGSTINSLCAGVYTVTATDTNGCTGVANITIIEPSLIVTTITQTGTILCFGDSTVSLTASSTGGTAPYTYVWSTGDTTSTITNVGGGSYSVTTTDASGCTVIATYVVTQPADLVLSYTITNPISCNGVCDGSVVVIAVGGTPGISFLWPDGSTSPTKTGLCAGTNIVTVTDANGCSDTISVVLSEPDSILITSAVISNVSCNGVCDGEASITATGGTLPYVVTWPGGLVGPIQDTLCAGVYPVTVTDANGCFNVDTVTITEPVVLSLVVNQTTPILCNGVCNAVASATPVGGTGPYTVIWPTNDTTNIKTNLCAGIYIVTVVDANSCMATQSITIIEPTAININLSITNPISCNGVCDGEVTMTVSGGTLPYSYSWSNGDTTLIADSLCDGTYYVTVTDGNGCTAIDSIDVIEPTLITPTIVVTDATCGVCDGIIAITNTIGGDGGPYTYSWSSGPSTPTISNLCPGSYTVTITDGSGCFIEVTVPVSNISGPTGATFTQVSPTCNGMCDGSLTVTPIGGTLPLTYAWSSGGTDTTETNLCAGIYFVTITDAQGCVFIATDTLTEPDPITNVANIIDPSCNGVCDGIISVAPTGGTGPYFYMWSTTDTTNIISNLCSGTYYLTTTDVNGCTKVDSFMVVDPSLIVITTNVVDATCNGICNGSASASATGGVPAITFAWSNGDTGSIASNLCGGTTYYVTATDANGCTSVDSVLVGEPTAISLDSIIVVNPDCGVNNGSLEAIVSGGTPGYGYTWNGVSGNPITNIGAGLYELIVTDANGCTFTAMIPLSNVGGPTVSVTTTDVPCSGDCVGTATAVVSGGASPYSYLWSNNDTMVTADSLCAGQVQVVVTDSAGCITSDTGTVVQINGLLLNIAGTNNTNCDGVCNGLGLVAVTGGTGALTYIWSNGDTVALATGLCAGTHSVTVTDATGCSAIDSITIMDVAPLLVNVSNVVDATCLNTSDGAIQIVVSGGIPSYTFSWSGPGFTATTQNISNLLPGVYVVTVTDSVGCEIIDTAEVVAITELEVFLADTSTCNESDTIVLNPVVTGGNGTVVYQWYNSAGGVIGNDSILLVTSPPDTTYYSVQVVSGGCSSLVTAAVGPSQMPDVDAGDGETIIAGETVVLGGNPTTSWGGSTFIWSPDNSLNNGSIANPTASPNETTLYRVEVTNILGCTNTDTVLIQVKKKFDVISGFTPNGDGNNDVWELDFLEKYPSSTVDVYNRWGELLFHSTDGYKVPWDGKYQGEDLPVGTYYYVIDLADGKFPDPLSGPITIMR